MEARRRVRDAVMAGDIAALREALGSPEGFPNTPLPAEWAMGDEVLFYALAHAPLAAVRAILEAGASPNREALDGFPSLFVAVDSSMSDRLERLALLREHGADLEMRGFNDHTPLLYAVSRGDAEATGWLLAHGADPAARSRIDHGETALEIAERNGFSALAEQIRRLSKAGSPDDR